MARGRRSRLATPTEARARPEETRKDRRRIQELKREMQRKDKGLVETPALLVLCKRPAAPSINCWRLVRSL